MLTRLNHDMKLKPTKSATMVHAEVGSGLEAVASLMNDPGLGLKQRWRILYATRKQCQEKVTGSAVLK